MNDTNSKSSTLFERITRPSVFANSAVWEWVKFFIGSVIMSFLAYLLISNVFPKNMLNQDFLVILIALLFVIMCVSGVTQSAISHNSSANTNPSLMLIICDI